MGRKKKEEIENEVEKVDIIPDDVTEEPEIPFVIDPIEEEEPVKPKRQAKKKATYIVKLDDPTSFLNIREGAGTQYPNCGILREGDIISTENAPEDGWLKIDQGYVLFSKLRVL